MADTLLTLKSRSCEEEEKEEDAAEGEELEEQEEKEVSTGKYLLTVRNKQMFLAPSPMYLHIMWYLLSCLTISFSFFLKINLFIFGCVGSSFLCKGFL